MDSINWFISSCPQIDLDISYANKLLYKHV